MAGAAAPIEVAVGILRDADGQVLIGERTPGRSYAGYWEFPGGKLEPGECAETALKREFAEELGTVVESAEPLIRLHHAYPEYSVRLQVFEITRWSGAPRSVEGQALAWALPERLPDWRLLPADGPLVSALRLPRAIAVTPPDAPLSELIEKIPLLPAGTAVRLRAPALDDSAYARHAEALQPACRDSGRALILDRGESLTRSLGESICMVSVSALGEPSELLRGVSVHDKQQRDAASAADFLVLGPVQATPTHPDSPGLGWAAAEELLEHCPVPAYLIGGLAITDRERVIGAGAQGIAAIRAYWS